MIKTGKPKFSKKEYAIIHECCRQMIQSMEKQELTSGLDDLGKLIKEDIKIILKKLSN